MATLLQDMYAHQLINDMLTDLKPETTISGISGYNTSGTDVSVPAGVVNAMIKIFLSEKIADDVPREMRSAQRPFLQYKDGKENFSLL